MASDDADGLDRDEFEVAAAKLERDSKLSALFEKFVPRGASKERTLPGLLACRVIFRSSTFEESSASVVDDFLAVVNQAIDVAMSGMSEDELERAGVVAKRIAEEWRKEIKDLGVPRGDGFEGYKPP